MRVGEKYYLFSLSMGEGLFQMILISTSAYKNVQLYNYWYYLTI